MASKKNQEPDETVTLTHATRGTRIRVAASDLDKYRRQGYQSAGAPASAAPVGDPDESWTLAQLNTYANQNNVDLGGATRKADVLDALLESQLDNEE